MLISTTEELRLYSPANAIDHIDTIAGFLDSAEHDFLEEKLGSSLLAALTAYYQELRSDEEGISTYVNNIVQGATLPPYATLLNICQRIVAFDGLGRAIDLQAVSVNGAGVNIATADDYGKADTTAITAYKQTCSREAHAACNRLLVKLEEWCQQTAEEPDPADEDAEQLSDDQKEINEIVSKWKTSRYYYLAAQLILPSATVVQDYLNIYDSRERYIAMLSDIRFVQEDILMPALGEDFVSYIVEQSIKGTDVSLVNLIIHKLRKCCARYLEHRTLAMKVGDARREASYNEALALTKSLSEYLQVHQGDMDADLLAAFKTSPLYVAPSTTETVPDTDEGWENNRPGNVLFVTPSL